MEEPKEMDPAEYALVYKMMMELLIQMRTTNEASRRWRETGELPEPPPETPDRARKKQTAFHQNW